MKTRLFKQHHEFFGTVDLYLAADGAKMVSGKKDFIISTHAPDWKVFVYRPADLSGMEMSAEEWHAKHWKLFSGKQALRGTPVPSIDENLHVPCFVLTMKSHGRYWHGDDPTVFQAAEKLYIDKIIYKSANIPTSKNVQAFLATLFSTNQIPGVPLKLTSITTEGTARDTFSTVAIREQDVPNTFFDSPPKLKHVDDVQSLLLTSKIEKQARSILEDLVDTEQATTKRK